jgi:hypothetical protein
MGAERNISIREEARVTGTCWLHAETLVSWSASSSILKMEATCHTETSVDFQRPTQRYIPEDRFLEGHGFHTQ